MSKIYLLGLVLALLISSCNGNNENNNPIASQEEISTSNEEIVDTSTTNTPKLKTPEPKTPPSPSELCKDVQISESEQPITLSNLQFHRSPPTPFDFDDPWWDNMLHDADQDNLIGCVTNHTQKPIANLRLEINNIYQSDERRGGGSGLTTSPGNAIQPGETLPFRHGVGLDSDVVAVQINTVTTYKLPENKDSYIEPIESFELDKTVTYVPAKVPPAETAEQFCADLKPTQSNQPLEVNKLQIYDPPQDPYTFGSMRESLLVGCITNHSDQPLYSLGMAYSSNGTGGGGGTVKIPVEEIPPKQTVAFRKFGSLSADTEFIVVHSISGNVGELKLGVTVKR